jgi:hypothetical protein
MVSTRTLAKTTTKLTTVAALVALASTLSPAEAWAHPTHATAASARAERVETSGPNRRLLTSGAWTLGVSYVPALVVAIKSERRGDDYLYYPVVGPWLDLGHRGDCATCERETLNQVLLVTDGVFQGVGALQIVGAFLLPERRSVYTTSRRSEKPAQAAGLRLRVRPVRVSGGYGLEATARF